MNVNELPQYKCHKVVRAAKITAVAAEFQDGHCELSFDSNGEKWLAIGDGFYEKHEPRPGKYFVVYEDGYQSVSPAAAFEAGYTLVEVGTSCGGAGGDDDFPDNKDMQEAGKYTSGADWAQEANGIDLEAADFSDALMWLKEGKRVCRSGWNGAGQWVEMCNPEWAAFYYDFDRDIGYPIATHFGLKNAQGVFVPGWTPSTGDLMASDWQVYEELVSDIPPHQLRVLEELAQLTDRLDKLTAFFDTDVYRSLDVDERGRLKEQCALMGELQRVLTERVAAF